MSKVLITGTSKGIGYDASLHLARAGHEVIATMRNPSVSDLEEVAKKESLPVSVHVLDVDSQGSVDQLFADVGEVDVLVNNAGILSYNSVEDESIEMFQAIMNTNYFGTLRCTKAVIPQMRERCSGCIINISSVAGRMAVSPNGAYSSSKFAIEGFSDILAQEMAGFGVRVHVIEPGIIMTPMTTTELPQPKKDSIYPQGRRMMAIYKFASQGEAPVVITSIKLQYLIENNVKRLRHPAGPDALVFLGLRGALSDERLIEIFSMEKDEDFIAAYQQETLVDLTPFMD
jgi:NAD(P)-dependent dehydrogenase (short-subunit alcohol dehydrogenase family)